MTKFAALPGFYQALFLYLEPASTIVPAIIVWGIFGESWFHHQLIPSTEPPPAPGFLEARTVMAIWQLANCYLLLGLVSSLVFRAARDALPNDPVAQERIVGALLAALALADITQSVPSILLQYLHPTYLDIFALFSIIASIAGLPAHLQYNPAAWNGMTHGNITVVVVLFACRVAWFWGIGRTRYFYGQDRSKTVKAS